MEQPAPVVPDDMLATFTRERLLQIIVTGPDASGAEQNALARIALALMPPEQQEPATDNTAQQFESLAENTEPCVICGVVSSHPEGWHYCHATSAGGGKK